ncbi:flagellin [Methanococcus aeolicus]|nr:flagellin [Methanococcus aeolicus]
MNLKHFNFLKNKKGAMGIGTLIIFIAMVLVAAVAASVLINTSGFLQQKASSTGKESTEQVASGIQILQISGMHNTTHMNNSAIYVTPNAGSSAIDLSQSIIILASGTSERTISYNISKTQSYDSITTGGSVFGSPVWDNLTSKDFGIIVIVDSDGSCQNITPVINKGDLVVLALNTADMDMTPRTIVTGLVRPEFGAPGVISYMTPATYINDVTVVRLQ